MTKASKSFFPISADHLVRIVSDQGFIRRVRAINLIPSNRVRKLKVYQELRSSNYSFNSDVDRRKDRYLLFDICSKIGSDFSKELKLLSSLRQGYSEGRLLEPLDVRPIRGSIAVNRPTTVGVFLVQEKTQEPVEEKEIENYGMLYDCLLGLSPREVIEKLEQTGFHNAAYIEFNKKDYHMEDGLVEKLRKFEFSPTVAN